MKVSGHLLEITTLSLDINALRPQLSLASCCWRGGVFPQPALHPGHLQGLGLVLLDFDIPQFPQEHVPSKPQQIGYSLQPSGEGKGGYMRKGIMMVMKCQHHYIIRTKNRVDMLVVVSKKVFWCVFWTGQWWANPPLPNFYPLGNE